MARGRLGKIVEKISGSVGGVEFRSTPLGNVMTKGSSVPRGPMTGERRASGTLFGAGSKAWGGLTDAQRDAWGVWAEAAGFRAYSPARAGFIGVAFWRQVLGLEPLMNPPGVTSLAAVVTIESVAGWSADTSPRFRVTHGVTGSLEGLWLSFEMTKPPKSAGRRPYVTGLRSVRGVGAASCVPLGASGTVYELVGCRFAVPVGERFGAGVRLVSKEGVVSERRFAILRRS